MLLQSACSMDRTLVASEGIFEVAMSFTDVSQKPLAALYILSGNTLFLQ